MILGHSGTSCWILPPQLCEYSRRGPHTFVLCPLPPPSNCDLHLPPFVLSTRNRYFNCLVISHRILACCKPMRCLSPGHLAKLRQLNGMRGEIPNAHALPSPFSTTLGLRLLSSLLFSFLATLFFSQQLGIAFLLCID